MTSGLPSGLVGDDGFTALLGLAIGTGSSRLVLQCNGHPGFVIKLGYRPGAIANWTEWLLWQQIRDEAKLRACFGRCEAISTTGKYLLMERLDDVPAEKLKERQLPPWITDRKPSAFGVSAAGEVKLRDFAQLNLGWALAGYNLEKLTK